MVVGAVLIARLPSSSAHVRGFTALWAVPVSQADSRFSIGHAIAKKPKITLETCIEFGTKVGMRIQSVIDGDTVFGPGSFVRADHRVAAAVG